MKNTNRNILLLIIFLYSICGNSQSYKRGILPGIDSTYNSIPVKAKLTRGFYDGAPSYYSLKKYAPIPASQGQFGTCTGWAVAYAARTIIEAQLNGWTDKQTITSNAFSPTFQYRQGSNASDCNGAYTSQIVESLKTIGSVPKKEFYVNYGTALCPSAPVHYSNNDKAKNYRIEEYATLWDYTNSDYYGKIDRVKSSISQGNPVVISLICPDSFDGVGESGLWTPTESPNESTNGRKHGRHALCVVGYDNNKFGGAFEIQNSWGKWGNEGYCWIKYDDFADFAYQAYEIVNLGIPEPEEPLLAGSLRLFDLDDNKDLEMKLLGKTRNWNVVGPSKGGNFTYEAINSLVSGSEMRMYLKSESPAYVYMLGTGTKDKKILKLFPVDGISPALNYSNSEVALPSEEHYFKMDNTTGENYIIILFSKTKLDINKISQDMGNGNGTVSENLEDVVGNILISSDNIQFEKNEIKFKVSQNESDKKAFGMIIKFDQVE